MRWFYYCLEPLSLCSTDHTLPCFPIFFFPRQSSLLILDHSWMVMRQFHSLLGVPMTHVYLLVEQVQMLGCGMWKVGLCCEFLGIMRVAWLRAPSQVVFFLFFLFSFLFFLFSFLFFLSFKWPSLFSPLLSSLFSYFSYCHELTW